MSPINQRFTARLGIPDFGGILDDSRCLMRRELVVVGALTAISEKVGEITMEIIVDVFVPIAPLGSKPRGVTLGCGVDR